MSVEIKTQQFFGGDILQLPYSESLDIARFSHLFDNKSECYKLFWFKAIVNKVCEGNITPSFEELVDQMIADAWYMVTEFHLNLGPNDTLEKAVRHMSTISKMKSSEKKEKILKFLKESNDKELIKYKKTLTYNVPYRLQSPFMESMKGKEWNRGAEALADRINHEKRLMYYFLEFKGLETRIHVQDKWAMYITVNKEILYGWIELNMITYLQRRNPSVPGIVDKIYPPQERKLDKVKKYWKLLISMEKFYEIYGHNKIDEKDISIDHFVPWSYVAHDELWNLNPTKRCINSSKSNCLPVWDKYFPLLAEMEFTAYKMMWEYPKVHEEFDRCAKEHLNNQEIKGRLYRENLSEGDFTEELRKIIFPVYQSAENAGFSKWTWEK